MDKKKQAAAMAAVYAYITDEEAAQALQGTGWSERGSSDIKGQKMMAGQKPNLWGLTGRQSMMQANTMMQLRMFK